MPDDAALRRFLAASSYNDPVDAKKLRFVFSAIESHARSSGRSLDDLEILEVACGVGGITLPLATLGARVRAFDLDETDAGALRRTAAEHGYGNLEVTVEDALSFDDGAAYDVVVASEVFEHLVDPGRLADVIARHTRPGGLLIVTTPNGYGPWEAWNSVKLVPRRWGWLRRALGKPPHDGAGREHEQRYTRRRIVELLGSRSFRLVAFSNSDFVFTVVRSLRRNRFVGALDARLGDVVPHWMASGWYMAFVLEGKPAEVTSQ
jgi:SAM-dependent methyltransferase